MTQSVRLPYTRFGLALLLLLALLWPMAAPAQTAQASAQTIWRLLDYVAVDYPGAIQDGQIISQLEYDEMIEFSGSIRERMATLPAHADRRQLVEMLDLLELFDRAAVDGFDA